MYDKFLERFKALPGSKKIGDPFDLETNQGPQVSKTQLDVSSTSRSQWDHRLTVFPVPSAFSETASRETLAA